MFKIVGLYEYTTTNNKYTYVLIWSSDKLSYWWIKVDVVASKTVITGQAYDESAISVKKILS